MRGMEPKRPKRLSGASGGAALVLKSTNPFPGVDQDAPSVVTRQARESKRLEGTAGEIVLAARALYETQGVADTSIAQIARQTGIARSLVYYYFPDKESVTAAVLDDYIEDLLETVSVWNELRAFGNTPGELQNCVAAFRRSLYTASGSPRPMIAVLEELGVRDAFATRAVRETVACIQRTIVAEYAAYRSIEIDLVPETFCLLLFGIVGLMKAKPDVTDDEIAILIAQTLRLDMSVMNPPPWPEAPSTH